ncbi:MAG: hypothetical protein EAZ91_07505 [Cytophagales bacterium]|nr:MAG: hypothetical protein EAZ91_07505 [Cytophagales bacterium]
MEDNITVWRVNGETRSPLFVRPDVANKHGLKPGFQLTDVALIEQVEKDNANPVCTWEPGQPACDNCGS